MPDGTRTAFGASHWGAFTAEAVDGRLVAVTPFAGDPASRAVHPGAAGCGARRMSGRPTGGAKVMAGGRAGDPPGDARRRALRRGELGPGARSRRGRAREGQGGIRERGDLRQLGLGQRRRVSRRARPAQPLPQPQWRLRRPGHQLQLRRGERDRAAHRRLDEPRRGTGKYLAGHRRAHRPDGRLRGHAAEEPERQPGRPRHARGGGLASPRRRSGDRVRLRRTDPRRRRGRDRGPVAFDPAQHRSRGDARARAHPARGRAARRRFPRPLLHRVRPTLAAYLLGESDGTAKDAEWASGISEMPAESIRGLAPPDGLVAHADRRQLVGAAGRPRGAALLDDRRARRHAGARSASPGGGFGFGYGAMHGIGAATRQGRAAQDSGRQERCRLLDPGGAAGRHAAQPRRALQLQRRRPDLPGHQADLLVRRQSVPQAAGPQQPAQGLGPAGDDNHPRAVVDTGRQAGRHRAPPAPRRWSATTSRRPISTASSSPTSGP